MITDREKKNRKAKARKSLLYPPLNNKVAKPQNRKKIKQDLGLNADIQ